MKQFILFFTVVACLLSACNNNTKAVDPANKDSQTTVSADASQLQQVSEEMKKQTEDLQKLQPLSLDELKALLPETIMGAKRSKFEATSMSGTGFASAEYNLNDSTEIKVDIWDCAGPAGAGLYSTQYLGMFSIQSVSDDEYTKTIDFKGEKAIENCKTSNNRCTLTYFTGKRYMVALEGRNMHPDGLKQAAGELKI